MVHLGGLGDVVQSLPDLRRIRASAPDARLDLLIANRVEPLVRNMTGPDRVWTLTVEERRVDWLEAGRLALRLRRERYDIVVNLLPPGSRLGAVKMALFLRVIGGGGRAGVEGVRAVLRTNSGVTIRDLSFVGARAQPQASAPQSALLARVPVSPQPRPAGPARFVLEAGEEGRVEVEAWLKAAGLDPAPAGGLIGVAPGSAWPAKRWVPERFAWVADQLVRETGGRIVLVGDEADRPAAEAVASRLAAPAASAVGRLSLHGFLALAGRLRLLLTNDSGAMHLAASPPGTGAPIVAVFGPGDVDRYAPAGARVVRHPVPCAPCNWAVCPIGNPCLTAMPVEHVLTACREMLGGSVHVTA